MYRATGYYIASSENLEYVFYVHTPSATSGKFSLIKCDNDRMVTFGFAQSKKSEKEYKPWYDRLWNINGDKVDLDKITISPHISKQGIFTKEFYYNGKIGSKLKFSYREFTTGGFARDSFRQDVIYDLNDSSIIGFKGAKFEVLDATNTTIQYKVVRHFR